MTQSDSGNLLFNAGRFSYSLKPPSPSELPPRTAKATAQLVNRFVVGAFISDGGSGYSKAPAVVISGGGGSGATAIASVENGTVTKITIQNPGSGYTSVPTITIAPPPPRKAEATSEVVNGFVVGAKVTSGGFGYDTAPTVLLVGGGGVGATASAKVADGFLVEVTITNPGSGYTSTPLIRIASPISPPTPLLSAGKLLAAPALAVRMQVILGRKYQMESTKDMVTWTPTGPAFIAEDEELEQEFEIDAVGRYFRINQVP